VRFVGPDAGHGMIKMGGMPGRMESLLFASNSKFHRPLCMSSKVQTPLHGHNNSVVVQTSVLFLFGYNLFLVFSVCLACLGGAV